MTEEFGNDQEFLVICLINLGTIKKCKQLNRKSKRFHSSQSYQGPIHLRNQVMIMMIFINVCLSYNDFLSID